MDEKLAHLSAPPNFTGGDALPPFKPTISVFFKRYTCVSEAFVSVEADFKTLYIN